MWLKKSNNYIISAHIIYYYHYYEQLKSYDSSLSVAKDNNDTHAPQHTTSGISNTSRPRRQTISHQNPSVVLVGMYKLYFMGIKGKWS